MDVYILDELFRRDQVVDTYESMIWAERYTSIGDFHLKIKATRENRNLFVADTRIGIDRSRRVMAVDTVEDARSDDGVAILDVKGQSLERILEDRVCMYSMEGSELASDWNVEGKPADIMRLLFRRAIVEATLNPDDAIPYYVPGSVLSSGTIPEPQEIIKTKIEIASLYDNLKKFGEMYNLGFRLYKGDVAGTLQFDVYTGDNRTTRQSSFPAVVFSEELGNLTDTKELTTTAQLKNVAYVISKHGYQVVYANDDVAPPAGLDRRVLMVKADDIELTAGAELMAALTQRGKEELAKHRVVRAFDGETPQEESYIYGVHYNLGDIVEKRNGDGLTTDMRVTEQIFVRDTNGFRAYPTLTINQLIEPGTWLAQPAGVVWATAPGEWANA